MRTIFKNNKFYQLLIGLIISLIVWNIYVGVMAKNIFALLPIAIQSVLLILILTHNHYARISILIWTTIFIIIGPGLIVLGNSLKIIDKGFKQINPYFFVFNLISIIIGVVIVSYTKRTVVVRSDNEIITPHASDRQIDY
jgi:hypothetical protein